MTCKSVRMREMVFLPDKERGLKVFQLFPEAGNLGLVLPPALAHWTLEKVKKGESVECLLRLQ